MSSKRQQAGQRRRHLTEVPFEVVHYCRNVVDEAVEHDQTLLNMAQIRRLGPRERLRSRKSTTVSVTHTKARESQTTHKSLLQIVQARRKVGNLVPQRVSDAS